MKKKLTFVLIVLTMAILYTSSCMAAGTVEFTSRLNPTYKVTCSKLVVHKKANSYSRKVTTLKRGDKVILNTQKGNWVKIKKGTKVGWVLLSTKDGRTMKRIKNGWVRCNGKWYYKTKTKTIVNNFMYRANKNIYGIKSDSDVMIVVDKNRFMVYTFYRKDGVWIPHDEYACNTGMETNETPCGIFTVFKKLDYFAKNGYIYPYAMRFWHGCFVHSQACYVGQKDSPISKDILQIKSTHGCVSMANKGAKWAYERCEVGKTKVVVTDRAKDKWKNW